MIDTIKVRFQKEIFPDVDQDWDEDTRKNKKRKSITYSYHLSLPESGSIHVIYYPAQGNYVSPCLMFEFSVPKILFGNNFTKITKHSEILEAFDKASNSIESIPCLPPLNLSNGVINRIDILSDHYVGANFRYYLDYLRTRHYPRRKPFVYSKNGIKFHSKMTTTTFYDKGEESQLPDAKGWMRLEIKYNDNNLIAEKLKNSHPTIQDINLERVKSELSQEITKLGLCYRIIMNDDILQKICINEFGRIAGGNIYSYCKLRQTATLDEISHEYGWKRSSLLRYERKLKKANISYTKQSASIHYLEPLKICNN